VLRLAGLEHVRDDLVAQIMESKAGQAGTPQAQHYSDFDHRDLAIDPASWASAQVETVPGE
jgi:hypothetical protein